MTYMAAWFKQPKVSWGYGVWYAFEYTWQRLETEDELWVGPLVSDKEVRQ